MSGNRNRLFIVCFSCVLFTVFLPGLCEGDSACGNNSTTQMPQNFACNVNLLLIAILLYSLLVALVCAVLQAGRFCYPWYRRRRRHGRATLMTKAPPRLVPRLTGSATPLLVTASTYEQVGMTTFNVTPQTKPSQEHDITDRSPLPRRLPRLSFLKRTGNDKTAGAHLSSDNKHSPQPTNISPTSPRSYLILQNASYEDQEESNSEEHSSRHSVHSADNTTSKSTSTGYISSSIDTNVINNGNNVATSGNNVTTSGNNVTTTGNTATTTGNNVTTTGNNVTTSGNNVTTSGNHATVVHSVGPVTIAASVKSATTSLQATSLSDSDDDEDDAYDDTVYPTWTVANPLVDDDEYDDVVGLAAGSDSPYDEPPDDEQSIYDVFEAKKYCYIPQQAVRITKLIGKGFFATVHMGVWDTGTKNIEIAVKRLNDNTDREYRVKFLQEAAIIGQFNHPHIIKLIGVIPEDKQLGVTCAIITELMPGGDLQKHLLDIQAKLLRREITAIGNVLLLYARQISAGMHYLSARKYIHRDLAARNVLLTAKHLCKIADFGLSRSLNDDIYYKSVDGIVSWKWTAPEALEYGTFSSASDVWSFGCVLFEIWSLGKTPMTTVDKTRIIPMLKKAYRMPPPCGCPREIHRLITECWHPDHSKRPRFSQLCRMLKTLECAEDDGTTIYSGISSSASTCIDLQTIYESITN